MRGLIKFFQPREVGLLESALPVSDKMAERTFTLQSNIAKIKQLQADDPDEAQKVIARIHRSYHTCIQTVELKDKDRRDNYQSFLNDGRCQATAGAGVASGFLLHYLNKLADAAFSSNNCRASHLMSKPAQFGFLFVFVMSVEAFFSLNFESEKEALNTVSLKHAEKARYYADILEGIGRKDLLDPDSKIDLPEETFAPY